MAELGVVILHRDRWPAVRETIESVLANGVDPESIVLVDNASSTGALAALRATYPAIPVLGLTRNGGYAAGMNAGVRTWPDRDVLLLTHDCLLEPGAVAALRAQLVDPAVGMAGPLLCLRSRPDVVWSAGGRFRPPRHVVHVGYGESRASWAHAPVTDVDWLDGACLLVRGDALRAVGEFDERYFLYFEETDLSFRVRRAGWRVVCVRDAVAGQEPGERPEALYVRNRLRFLARQVSRRAALRQGLHELRRIARLTLSSDAGRRRRGALAARGLLASVWPADPPTLYSLSLNTDGRRPRTGA